MSTQPSTAYPASGLARLRVQSVVESAVEEIRSAILGRRLNPGARLVEQKLAGSLGIGQPTLREALKELEFQGFVRKIPKRGTYVTKLAPEDFRKILEVRMVLEALAVETAAPNLTKDAVGELEGIVQAMEKAAAEFRLATFHKHDVAFHRKLWAFTGNEYLVLTLERVAFGLFAFVLLERDPKAANEFVAAAEQHRQILDGLRSRDPWVAREAFVSSTLHFWNEYHGVGISRATVAGTPSISINEGSFGS